MSIQNKVRLPRQVNVKGSVWKVKQSKTLKAKEDCEGLCDPDKKTITLDNTSTPERMEYVLKHEVNHAIMYELHLTEAHGLTDAQQEIIAEGFNSAQEKIYDMTFKTGRKK